MESDTVDPDRVESARQLAASADRVVVKAGTNSLTDSASNLDESKLDKLVDDIDSLKASGTDVVLVSSGAVGAGRGRIGNGSNGLALDTLEASQALSTVGQSRLMHRYTQSFERYDHTVAQILLSDHDFENTERYLNFKNTIETLLSWDVIPVINENDAVATEEIKIGDNDMLSASVAMGIDAGLLVTLTDVDGVYTANPKENADSERIEAVGQNFAAVFELIDANAVDEFGGIRTKVKGARDVSERGIPAIIARGTEPDVLEKIANGKPVGTVFVPVNDDR